MRAIGRGFNFLITKNKRPVAVSQLYFKNSDPDWNGVSRMVQTRSTKFSFDKSFRNGMLFLVLECDQHSKSSERIEDS